MPEKKKVCPKGEILRKGYVRKSYKRADGSVVKKTTIKAACTKNVGLPGKQEPTIILKNMHTFSNEGYIDVKKLSQAKRRAILNKLVKKHGHIYVIRGLLARANLNIRKDPKASKIFKEDQEYVSKKYASMKK